MNGKAATMGIAIIMDGVGMAIEGVPFRFLLWSFRVPSVFPSAEIV